MAVAPVGSSDDVGLFRESHPYLATFPEAPPTPMASAASSTFRFASYFLERDRSSASVTFSTWPSASCSYVVAWFSGSVTVVLPAADGKAAE